MRDLWILGTGFDLLDSCYDCHGGVDGLVWFGYAVLGYSSMLFVIHLQNVFFPLVLFVYLFSAGLTFEPDDRIALLEVLYIRPSVLPFQPLYCKLETQSKA